QAALVLKHAGGELGACDAGNGNGRRRGRKDELPVHRDTPPANSRGRKTKNPRPRESLKRLECQVGPRVEVITRCRGVSFRQTGPPEDARPAVPCAPAVAGRLARTNRKPAPSQST